MPCYDFAIKALLGHSPRKGADHRRTRCEPHKEQKRGLVAADTVAVDDGANDLPMLQTAGMGVALHAKPKVQEQAGFVVNHGDLTALLYLQGFTQGEFVV